MQKAYGERSVTMRHLLQGGYPMNQLLKSIGGYSTITEALDNILESKVIK